MKVLPRRPFTQHVARLNHTVAIQSENRQGFVASHESAKARGVAVPGVSKPNDKCNSEHDLKDFNAHSGNAAISDSQRARRAKGKVENAAANPGAPIDNAHHHRLGARRISYANSCAERQAAVSCSHGIAVEDGAAGCFALRIRIERCFPGKSSIGGPRS